MVAHQVHTLEVTGSNPVPAIFQEGCVAVLTLASVKSEMGIAVSNTGDDADLLRVIRQVVARIRQRTDRGIAWVTDSIEQNGSAVQLRVLGHGWRTGQLVKIEGSNCTPTIDGQRTITRVDEDHVSIPAITLTDVAEKPYATIHPKITKEMRNSSNTRLWVPEQVTPFLSVESISERTVGEAWEIIDSADYDVTDDPTNSKAVEIVRSEGTFPRATRYPRGQYGLRERSNYTTVKITVWAGTPIVPDDVVMAGLSMVNDVWERAGRGKDEQSFSFEGSNRTSMSGDERREHLLSPDAILSSWTAR